MSFCRITGKSRGLPKPNYFPLLAPISPADAKRFCKITGKSYGLASHHYIPVILTTFTNRTKCRITSSKKGGGSFPLDTDYGQRKHVILADFRYIFPAFDETDEQQRLLIDLLNSKECLCPDENYIYRVTERKCNLVFPARLEAAVRDGDVRDIMLAKDSDTILLKMRQGKNVSVDLHDYDVLKNSLFDGEGPRMDVILEQELEEKEKKRRTKRGKGSLLQMANIFESKERVQDEERLVEASVQEVKRKKQEARKAINKKCKIDLRNEESLSAMRSECSIYLASGDWRDLVKPVIESWDWDTYEKEAKSSESTALIQTLPTPCILEPSCTIPARSLTIDTNLLIQSSGFDAVPCIGNLSPSKNKIHPDFIEAIKNLPVTKITSDLLTDQLLESTPKSFEIIDILKNISSGGTYAEENGVSGMYVQINDIRKVFVIGQKVTTKQSGIVFVPGQTQATVNGIVFVPGITINTPSAGGSSSSSFIPGTLLSENGEQSFQAGHIIDNEFVSGQIMHNGERRFVEGQTVVTAEGLRFVAGQFDEQTNVFVSGQSMQINKDEVKFVPGQMITCEEGDRFIAGQNVYSEKTGWTFVPGQAVNGQFLPGISIIMAEGSKFVPGQYVDDIFVPGIISKQPNEPEKFVPGLNVETKLGPKFIEGQMVRSQHGTIFMPGKSTVNELGIVDFTVAHTVNDMIIQEPTTNDFVIDPATGECTKPSLSVYGHMVQTEKGIEFYPGNIHAQHLPQGKVIPGKLIKQDVDSKFVPGIMENGGFIPGQVVWTDQGEQFIPGQVIETDDGLKFVPGQVIETKGGSKFVPGQSVNTPDGVRFVPGQIVQTKAGPTFIPGQVIYTEDEGERFVPGQVVDTEDGPRFVPGRVVENGDKVTFIPGQIVQTDDGPRFVAPDLSDIEGEQHFSVQSFLINPEELSLIKSGTWTKPTNSKGELSIDSQMLRQLSAAGMKIGRQIEASAVDIVLQSTRDKQTLEKLSEKLQLSDEAGTVKLQTVFENLKTIINTKNGAILNELCVNGTSNFSAKINEYLCKQRKSSVAIEENALSSINSNNNNTEHHSSSETMQLVDVLVSTVLAVITTSNELSTSKNKPKHYNSSLYELITEKLVSKIEQGDDDDDMTTTAASIMSSLNQMSKEDILSVLNLVDVEVERILKECTYISKVDLIKSTISENQHLSVNKILENLCSVLDIDGNMSNAIRHLVEKDSTFLHTIIRNLENKFSDDQQSTMNITELVQKSIVAGVRESADNEIKSIFNVNHADEMQSLLKKAVALSRALGHPDTTAALQAALAATTENTAESILENPAAKDIIQRILIMDKLTIRRPSLQQSLDKMIADPYASRKDPAIRELFRQSGVVTIDLPAKTQQLSNSNDVPMSFLCSENQLAMEDFLLRRQTKARGAFLIVKDGYQAVVPRELSRDVLTGKCAYTILDESGIHHFEPLHVFSALKLAAPSIAHRFSIYSCDMASDDYLTSASTAEIESGIPTATTTTPTTTSTLSSSSCDIQLKTNCDNFARKEKSSATDERIGNGGGGGTTQIFNKRRQLDEYMQNGPKVSRSYNLFCSLVLCN